MLKKIYEMITQSRIKKINYHFYVCVENRTSFTFNLHGQTLCDILEFGELRHLSSKF